MHEARERFLRAIAERIAADRIAELHLFPPIRQGGRETGVAVVAAYPEGAYVQGELPPPVGEPEGDDSAEPDAPPACRDAATEGDAPHPSSAADIEPTPGPPPVGDDAPEAGDERHRVIAARRRAATDAPRLVVYRASYRWTLKGPDRGRWEVDVTAEADAPLAAVADVVRGVHRRAGGEAEPERLSGDAVRAALSERPWAATTM
jgi:hypothetical protein